MRVLYGYRRACAALDPEGRNMTIRKVLFPWCVIHIRGGGDVAEWSKAHPC